MMETIILLFNYKWQRYHTVKQKPSYCREAGSRSYTALSGMLGIAVQHVDEGYSTFGNFGGFLLRFFARWFQFIRQMPSTSMVKRWRVWRDKVGVWGWKL